MHRVIATRVGRVHRNDAWAPLRLPSFRWYLCARTISMLGNGVASVALAFAVLDLTASCSSGCGASTLANPASRPDRGAVLADPDLVFATSIRTAIEPRNINRVLEDVQRAGADQMGALLTELGVGR